MFFGTQDLVMTAQATKERDAIVVSKSDVDTVPERREAMDQITDIEFAVRGIPIDVDIDMKVSEIMFTREVERGKYFRFCALSIGYQAIHISLPVSQRKPTSRRNAAPQRSGGIPDVVFGVTSGMNTMPSDKLFRIRKSMMLKHYRVRQKGVPTR